MGRKFLPLVALALFIAVFRAPAGEADAGGDDPGRAVAERYAADMEAVAAKYQEALDKATAEVVDMQPDDKSAGDAALIIGIFYHIGLFDEPDGDRAHKFMVMAWERNVLEAGATLGGMYLGFLDSQNETSLDDTVIARSFLEPAAEAGSRDAQRILGILYAEGNKWQEPDPAKAEGYLLAAARQGDPEALSRLGPLFERVAAARRENPDEAGDLPASPEEAVDPELVEAARLRGEEMNRMAEIVAAALEEKVVAAMRGDQAAEKEEAAKAGAAGK